MPDEPIAIPHDKTLWRVDFKNMMTMPSVHIVARTLTEASIVAEKMFVAKDIKSVTNAGIVLLVDV